MNQFYASPDNQDDLVPYDFVQYPYLELFLSARHLPSWISGQEIALYDYQLRPGYSFNSQPTIPAVRAVQQNLRPDWPFGNWEPRPLLTVDFWDSRRTRTDIHYGDSAGPGTYVGPTVQHTYDYSGQLISTGLEDALVPTTRVWQYEDYRVQSSRTYNLDPFTGSSNNSRWRYFWTTNGDRMTDAYDPYGNLYARSVGASSGPPSFGYTGQQMDPSGLVYLRARYYQPSLGRFTQPDPFEGAISLPAVFDAPRY